MRRRPLAEDYRAVKLRIPLTGGNQGNVRVGGVISGPAVRLRFAGGRSGAA